MHFFPNLNLKFITFVKLRQQLADIWGKKIKFGKFAKPGYEVQPETCEHEQPAQNIVRLKQLKQMQTYFSTEESGILFSKLHLLFSRVHNHGKGNTNAELTKF